MLERILLDSTYLLPIVGVAVKDIDKVLETLERCYKAGVIVIYYTHFNIFEIIGKLNRMRYNLRAVEIGLRSIIENFQQAFPTPESYITALRLKSSGFKDLIDLLLYATAVDNNLKLLTRDRDLQEFLEKAKEKWENTIMTEEEFLKNYEKI